MPVFECSRCNNLTYSASRFASIACDVCGGERHRALEHAFSFDDAREEPRDARARRPLLRGVRRRPTRSCRSALHVIRTGVAEDARVIAYPQAPLRDALDGDADADEVDAVEWGRRRRLRARASTPTRSSRASARIAEAERRARSTWSAARSCRSHELADARRVPALRAAGDRRRDRAGDGRRLPATTARSHGAEHLDAGDETHPLATAGGAGQAQRALRLRRAEARASSPSQDVARVRAARLVVLEEHPDHLARRVGRLHQDVAGERLAHRARPGGASRPAGAAPRRAARRPPRRTTRRSVARLAQHPALLGLGRHRRGGPRDRVGRGEDLSLGGHRPGRVESPRVRFDLQSHSIHSDGELPAAEVVARARDAGVELLALSDHDTVDGVDEALEAAGDGLRVVTAVEISSRAGRLRGPAHPRLRRRPRRRAPARRARALPRRPLRARGPDARGARGAGLGDRRRRRSTRGARAASRSAARTSRRRRSTTPPTRERIADEGLEDFSALLVAYLIPGAPAYRARTFPSVDEAIDLIHARRRRRGLGAPVLGHRRRPGGRRDDRALPRLGIDGVEVFYVDAHARAGRPARRGVRRPAHDRLIGLPRARATATSAASCATSCTGTSRGSARSRRATSRATREASCSSASSSVTLTSSRRRVSSTSELAVAQRGRARTSSASAAQLLDAVGVEDELGHAVGDARDVAQPQAGQLEALVERGLHRAALGALGPLAVLALDALALLLRHELDLLGRARLDLLGRRRRRARGRA